jgi:signal transduction histidine kinase
MSRAPGLRSNVTAEGRGARGGFTLAERAKAMNEVPVERRSEFRFPVVVPVEYFRPSEEGVMSYSSDLTKKGTFVTSDDPLSVGTSFSMDLTIPINHEASKIHTTKGAVVWNRILPFKSKRNGMGVKFMEPLPEGLLLRALAHNVKKLMKERDAKKTLEERVEHLESELESAQRLATLGRFVEKILFDLSNPILTVSGKLELIRAKMHRHKRAFEEQDTIAKEEFRSIVTGIDNDCREIDETLKGYRIISELAQIVEDDRESLEKKLKRKYNL